MAVQQFAMASYPATYAVALQENIAQAKSEIKITSPHRNTIWAISETAKIEWNTVNIDTSKSIRFYLVSGKTVVQELGSFKNIASAKGIILAKNIVTGNDYRVVGIELFPENKKQVAKFVTPYFKIENKTADARKKKWVASKNNTSEKKEATTASHRTTFEGRNISYVKELVFTTNTISISIWDHGRQDNDIVSIYLNGETVISKHSLTYGKKYQTITLDPKKKNDLFLYAHNLGTFPPNTVSIEITDGTISENIILNSDLKSCEAVLISVKR